MNSSVDIAIGNETFFWLSPDQERNILLQLNKEKITSSVPVLCFISFIILLGTLGNILVLITYFKQIHKNSTNFFIFCLAVFDLTSCIIALPAEMLLLLQPLTYNYPWLCKFHRFIAFSANLASGYTIVCISFDRYSRISRPHRRFSRRTCRRAVIIVVCLSLLIGSMAFFVYGIETVDIEGYQTLLGQTCGTATVAKGTVMPLLFSATILTAFVIGVIILSTVYIRLGILVRRWNKERLKSTGNRRFSKSTGTSEDSSSKYNNKSQKFHTDVYPFQKPLLTKDIDRLKSLHSRSQNGKVAASLNKEINDKNLTDDELLKVPTTDTDFTNNEFSETDDNNDDNSVASMPVIRPGIVKEMSHSLERNGFAIPDPSVHFDGTATLPLKRMSDKQREFSGKKVTRKKSIIVIADIKKRITLSKTTTMFIVATVAFVACHVPYVCVKVALVTNPDLEETLSTTQTVFYRLAEYSFAISSCVNPLIYSFLNPRFRSECRTLIMSFFKRISCIF